MEKVPRDIEKMLTAHPEAKEKWQGLTQIGQRDFVAWIESAKKPETRARRIASMSSRLASGKRRPCCYAIVPMNLYKALNENLKAKATWKTLSPDQGRDFVTWIDDSKDFEARQVRIVKTCTLLAAGKKCP